MIDACDVVFFDGNGDVDEARTMDAFGALSNQYECVVIPGFYGAGPEIVREIRPDPARAAQYAEKFNSWKKFSDQIRSFK